MSDHRGDASDLRVATVGLCNVWERLMLARQDRVLRELLAPPDDADTPLIVNRTDAT